MDKTIVIIGIGELGGEFARGFLRCGYAVHPVTRHMSIAEQATIIPNPALVLVAVPEAQLDTILAQIPLPWKKRLCLIQNELLPEHWLSHQIQNPTVAVVWFEKKIGMALTNILYTPVYGPHSALVLQALAEINIPGKLLTDDNELLYELLRKSLYIFTVNICGLVENTTVKQLWYDNTGLARSVAEEIIQILLAVTGSAISSDKLIHGMVEGIDDCPGRYCQGRRAKPRLERALQLADSYQIACPVLKKIAG